jgi:membrane-bound lytic murein transglycosylase A
MTATRTRRSRPARPNRLACATLGAVLLTACVTEVPAPEPDWGRPLPVGANALLPLGPGDVAPHVGSAWIHRSEVRPALERSLAWTRSPHAPGFFPIAGVDHATALASLERLLELLDSAPNASTFNAAVQREFEFFKSAGWDGAGGGVLFTGYCTPVLSGSTQADATYRHPLYALPPDLRKSPDGTTLGRELADGTIDPQYPTRRVIEAGMLEGQGLELVWLRDSIDAYIAHVNGSAIVQLTNGERLRFGYAGKNGAEYTSLGAELIADGHVAAEDMSLLTIRRWAAANPELVEDYLNRNDSYVFFTPIDGNPRGSLNQEVTPERTLATDKRLFPRAAAVFVDTNLPTANGSEMAFRNLMFDQDTGGAIRTAGRADIYLGVGHAAEAQAGRTKAPGQLYYLFLRDRVQL